MAELRKTQGDRHCVLLTEHLVGRGAQCALQLSSSFSSARHALLRWAGRHWEVLDLSSRNGTQLDGKRLESGRAYPLRKGAVLHFGPEERWQLADTSEPQPMAVALDTGSALLERSGMIGVPSTDSPRAVLLRDGGRGWKLEDPEHGVTAISNGQRFVVDGREYRFFDPFAGNSTTVAAASSRFDPPTLVFKVSSDEEFVELSIVYRTRTVPLGARGHNYLLLMLARSRQADAEAGLPDGDRGWLDKDDIADGLRITPQQVDGEVFRIRRHLCEHGVEEAHGIVERRQRVKQLRLGYERFLIERF